MNKLKIVFKVIEFSLYAIALAISIILSFYFKGNEYACVTVKELSEYGYVKNAVDDTRIVKVSRNNITKVIEEIKYVDEC